MKLALLGHENNDITTIYSHAIPFNHCDSWLREKLPKAVKSVKQSTAQAAEFAVRDKNSATIASLKASDIYGLDVLEYPLNVAIPNITQFYVLCRKPAKPNGKKIKTSIAATLFNEPGCLYDFLEPFKHDKINLSRIISRPKYGCPSEYSFFVDIDGNYYETKLQKTIEKIKVACSSLRIIGSYVVREAYNL